MSDVKETGPWEVFPAEDNSRIGLLSHDFTHDVVLWISGDFADFDERVAYAEEMAKRLNNETRLRVKNARLRVALEGSVQHCTDEMPNFRKTMERLETLSEGYQARLAAAEAVCRAAKDFKMNRTTGWEPFMEALAAWEAACREEQP